MSDSRRVWIVVSSRDARLLPMQRCLESAAESLGSKRLSWSYVHPQGASRSLAQPLNFTNLLSHEQGLESCLLGEASVARRYRRESWLSARKDYLLEMRGMQSYEHYTESFGMMEVEEGESLDAFEHHPEAISEYICLLGDFDDALEGINGCSVAKLTLLAKALMARFISAGDQLGLVLDDDKAACPLVAMIGSQAPLPRHIAVGGFWQLCHTQISIEALDGELRDQYSPGDALRLLGLQSIEDGGGKGLRVDILAAGECYSVLVRGALCGCDSTGDLQIYTETQALMSQVHSCLVRHKSSAMSKKMLSILATAPSENETNVWRDVWARVNGVCVVDGDDAQQESFCEDMSSVLSPREVFGPLAEDSPREESFWHGVADTARGKAREAALGGCQRAAERLSSGPGGGCLGFGGIALALYGVFGRYLFSFQLIPVLLGVGAISSEAALNLRAGDRASLLTGGGLAACAGLTGASYLYQSLLLTLVTMALLTVTVLQGRDPRVVYQERKQALVARAAEARAYVGRLVTKGAGDDAAEEEGKEEEEEEEVEEEKKQQELRPERGRLRGLLDSVTGGVHRAGSAAIGAIHTGVTSTPMALGRATGKVIQTAASGVTNVASGVCDVGKASVSGVASGAATVVHGTGSVFKATAGGARDLSLGGVKAAGHVLGVPGRAVGSLLGRGGQAESQAKADLKSKGDKARARQLKQMAAKGCGCLATKGYDAKLSRKSLKAEQEEPRGSMLSWFGKPQSEKTALAGRSDSKAGDDWERNGKPLEAGQTGRWVPLDWDKYRDKIGNCYDTVTGKTSEEKERSIEKCREKVAEEMKAEEKRKRKEAAEKRKREAEAAKAKKAADEAAAKAKKAKEEADEKAEDHKKKVDAAAK